MLGVEAKKAIAEEAEKLVNDGDALIIHGGSTCYLFALRLARRNVKIYTNSMPLASTLWQNGTCHLTIAGGELHRGPGILYSPVVESPEFYASKFFISAQGVAPRLRCTVIFTMPRWPLRTRLWASATAGVTMLLLKAL